MSFKNFAIRKLRETLELTQKARIRLSCDYFLELKENIGNHFASKVILRKIEDQLDEIDAAEIRIKNLIEKIEKINES